MWFRRLIDAFGKYRREYASAADAEETASYELTVSARRFAGRARKASDDKLSFSAALMKAGEVTAATRFIEELEGDVRVEEAALMEQINEVKVARAARRQKQTRLRLATVLATVGLGAGLLSFWAAGLAVGSFIADRHSNAPGRDNNGSGRVLDAGADLDTDPTTGADLDADSATGTDLDTDPTTGIAATRKVSVVLAGKTVKMSPARFRRYRELLKEEPDRKELELFLAGLLSDEEAEVVSKALAKTIASGEKVTSRVTDTVTRKVPTSASRKTGAAQSNAPEEPPAAPTDRADRDAGDSPSLEPTPLPEPSPSRSDSSTESDAGGTPR